MTVGGGTYNPELGNCVIDVIVVNMPRETIVAVHLVTKCTLVRRLFPRIVYDILEHDDAMHPPC